MADIIITLTDTIYGILTPALNRLLVERVYVIKERKPQKPCIILISDISELQKFGIYLDNEKKEKLLAIWGSSRPTSIILDIPITHVSQLEYLHRGTNTLAFRIPKWGTELSTLLQNYGPMIAPSANPEGCPPANNIKEAQAYFKHHNGIIYKESLERQQPLPSKIIRFHIDESIEIIRE